MLSYYFYKVVFLTVVILPLFILQHNGMHKVKILYVAIHSLHFCLHYCSQLYSIAATNSYGPIGDFDLLAPEF